MVSGGIAALNHRLKAGIPSACGSNTRNQKGQVFFCIPPSHLLSAVIEFMGKSEHCVGWVALCLLVIYLRVWFLDREFVKGNVVRKFRAIAPLPSFSSGIQSGVKGFIFLRDTYKQCSKSKKRQIYKNDMQSISTISQFICFLLTNTCNLFRLKHRG